MAITIDMIKQLREATAAGMGACKEALNACNGNMDEAVKYLREKGLAVAAKRVDKESKQGIVALAESADKKTMALAEVNCETDFVAKTEAFVKFVNDAAAVALDSDQARDPASRRIHGLDKRAVRQHGRTEAWIQNGDGLRSN